MASFKITAKPSIADGPKIAGPWKDIKRRDMVLYMVRNQASTDNELVKVAPTASGKWIWVIRLFYTTRASDGGTFLTKEECIEAADKALKINNFKLINDEKWINLI